MTANPTWLSNDKVVLAVIAAVCLIGPAIFVLTAHFVYHTGGFPLDDAWIYQVYARNLAHTGQWAFVAGHPSTGSTSVLWTLLIAPAYALGIDGRLWTLFLGAGALFATALAARALFAEDRPLARLLAALAIALEWHLVWAAVSGMETMLFAALVMWFWVWIRRRGPSLSGVNDGILLGLWGGCLALARPEGIVAFGVGAVCAGLTIPGWPSRFRVAGTSVLGLAILFVPWLAFNVATSGTIWPNTFAAKQVEYAPLQAVPYSVRLIEQFVAVWIGPQLLLIPGVVIAVRHMARSKPVDWAGIVPLAWAAIHLALYAARLPVVYQHARYAIPVIPVLVALGIRGLVPSVRPTSAQLTVRAGTLVWAATALILFPLFLVVLGAPAYGRDNQFIQAEMVETAHWIERNTPPDSVIALHDIGAVGYFAPRPVVDLAGLVSPDIIPIMGDEEKTAEFVVSHDSDYLIVFPRWTGYTRMVARPYFCKVWSADQVVGYQPASDLGPMTVFRVDPGGTCGEQP